MNQLITHTCPSCGYVWQHGHNGSHSCVTNLREKVKKLEIEVGERPTVRMIYTQTNFGIDDEKLHEVYEKAKSIVLKDGNQSSRSVAIVAMELILIEYRDALVKRLEAQF